MAKPSWPHQVFDYARSAYDRGMTYNAIRLELAKTFGFVTTVGAVSTKLLRDHSAVVLGRIERRKLDRYTRRQVARDMVIGTRVTHQDVVDRFGGCMARFVSPDRGEIYGDSRYLDFLASVRFEKMLASIPAVEPLPGPLIARGLTLLDLADSQCRWPNDCVNDDGKILFCGKPKLNRRQSYCEEHQARSLQ